MVGKEVGDDGDDGPEADFSALGKAGGHEGLFECFATNMGGRSLDPKPQRKELPVRSLCCCFFYPLNFTTPLRGTGCVWLPQVKKHVVECNWRMKKKTPPRIVLSLKPSPSLMR